MTTETMTTVGTTDDHGAGRVTVPIRVRITAAVGLLVLLALAGAGLSVYAIERAQLADETARGIEQELAEFAALNSTDPRGTAPTFDSPRGIISLFLHRNVPNDHEMLIGWWDGAPRLASPTDEDITRDPDFRAAALDLVAAGGSRTIEMSGEGTVLVTVQPVHATSGTDDGAALVIVTMLDDTRDELFDTMRTYAVVATCAWLLITALAAWQSGRLLAPIRALRASTQEISAGDLSRRLPVSGNDDLTELSRTLNGMLGRLEGAFTTQREFLDDAGHELKTPLTVLRGHLEVLEAGNPADVAETRDLLLDEVDRMARLVEDLILLAKSARPDFLHPGHVGLNRLVTTVHRKAAGLGDRDWQLDAQAPDDTLIEVDEDRVTQAVLQLCANAVKHTAVGERITVATHVLGDHAVITVADTGPGVPVADRERIFERFGRSVVPRDDEGFGLGLSIVAAIAAAHGGTVSVDDAPGGGARFHLSLPLRRTPSWPAS